MGIHLWCKGEHHPLQHCLWLWCNHRLPHLECSYILVHLYPQVTSVYLPIWSGWLWTYSGLEQDPSHSHERWSKYSFQLLGNCGCQHIHFCLFLLLSTLPFVFVPSTTDIPQSSFHILVICTLLAQVSDNCWKWNEHCHDAADRCWKCYQTGIGCSYNIMSVANLLYIDQTTIASHTNHSLHIDKDTWETHAIDNGSKAGLLIVICYSYSYLYLGSSPCLINCC